MSCITSNLWMENGFAASCSKVDNFGCSTSFPWFVCRGVSCWYSKNHVANRGKFYWRSMAADVVKCMKKCHKYQKIKTERQRSLWFITTSTNIYETVYRNLQNWWHCIRAVKMFSPFYLLYGFELNQTIDFSLITTLPDYNVIKSIKKIHTVSHVVKRLNDLWKMSKIETIALSKV